MGAAASSQALYGMDASDDRTYYDCVACFLQAAMEKAKQHPEEKFDALSRLRAATSKSTIAAATGDDTWMKKLDYEVPPGDSPAAADFRLTAQRIFEWNLSDDERRQVMREAKKLGFLCGLKRKDEWPMRKQMQAVEDAKKRFKTEPELQEWLVAELTKLKAEAQNAATRCGNCS
jgi:hypothetical protein